MKDWVLVAVVVFVLWYALRNGVFAQLGGGQSPASPFGGLLGGFPRPMGGNFISAETPWGNYAGGWGQ